jgi:hypothetical protein
VFEIVVSLEESITGEELDQDTPNTPDITGETPAKVQYDLGCPIVAGGHDRRVIFIIKCGRAKVNKTNLTVKKHPSLACIARVCVRGGGDGAVIGEGLVIAADEQNVFGFEIGVDEV